VDLINFAMRKYVTRTRVIP